MTIKNVVEQVQERIGLELTAASQPSFPEDGELHVKQIQLNDPINDERVVLSYVIYRGKGALPVGDPALDI